MGTQPNSKAHPIQLIHHLSVKVDKEMLGRTVRNRWNNPSPVNRMRLMAGNRRGILLREETLSTYSAERSFWKRPTCKYLRQRWRWP